MNKYSYLYCNFFLLQKLINFLFCRGAAFQLLEPFRLTSLDCQRGAAIDAEIQDVLNDLRDLADDEKDLHLVTFVNSLTVDTDVNQNDKHNVESESPEAPPNSEIDQLVSANFEEYVKAQDAPGSGGYSQIQESLIIAQWKSVKVLK